MGGGRDRHARDFKGSGLKYYSTSCSLKVYFALTFRILPASARTIFWA